MLMWIWREGMGFWRWMLARGVMEGEGRGSWKLTVYRGLITMGADPTAVIPVQGQQRPRQIRRWKLSNLTSRKASLSRAREEEEGPCLNMTF